MPYDDDPHARVRPSFGDSVADLVSRGDGLRDETELRAALRIAVNLACDPAKELWEKYRGARPGDLRTARH